MSYLQVGIMMQGPLAPASLMTLQYDIFQILFIPDHPDPEEKTCPLLLNLIKVYPNYSPPPLWAARVLQTYVSCCIIYVPTYVHFIIQITY